MVDTPWFDKIKSMVLYIFVKNRHTVNLPAGISNNRSRNKAGNECSIPTVIIV